MNLHTLSSELVASYCKRCITVNSQIYNHGLDTILAPNLEYCILLCKTMVSLLALDESVNQGNQCPCNRPRSLFLTLVRSTRGFFSLIYQEFLCPLGFNQICELRIVCLFTLIATLLQPFDFVKKARRKYKDKKISLLIRIF